MRCVEQFQITKFLIYCLIMKWLPWLPEGSWLIIHDTCIFIVHGSSTVVTTSWNLELLLGHIPSHAMQWPCNENPTEQVKSQLESDCQTSSTSFHVGYGNGLPLVCIMQTRSEKRHGGIKILALGMQVRQLWEVGCALMAGTPWLC